MRIPHDAVWLLPVGVWLLLTAVECVAADEPDAVTFDNPAQIEGTGSGLDLGLGDEEFTGNPAKSLFERWPNDLVVAPIPGRNPQLGWTLALAGGYFMKPQNTSADVRASVLGAYGLIAENGTYVFGAGVKLNLLDDKLRVTAGGGYADLRYRYYGSDREQGDIGIGVDILQEGPAYFVKARWRLISKFYAGISYLAGQIDTRLRFSLDTPGQFFDPTLSLDVGAISIPLEIDNRDHEQFPRSGWLLQADTRFYRDDFGSDFETETLKISANHYLPMFDSDVLATRLVVRAAGDDAPFFVLSTFGGTTDLRGYPGGRYRDRMMYALQSEYRWQVSDRLILTGFAGFGEVAGKFSEFGEDLLPAAGVGARFVISKKHRVSLSADLAVGDDGTEFYFGVGEAF